MSDGIQVLCDIHHTPMEMVHYQWRVFANDHNVSSYMRCTDCSRHYSPLQGYVEITEKGMNTSNRQANACKKGSVRWHGSMAIVAINNGEFVWKCLHAECRKSEFAAERNANIAEFERLSREPQGNSRGWKFNREEIQRKL